MSKGTGAVLVVSMVVMSAFLGSMTFLSGRANATSWSLQAVDPSGIVGSATSIALDGLGYPHISYRDGGNNDLKHAGWIGTAWNVETVDSVGAVGLYHTSIAIDSAGHPHIAYYNATGSYLKYAEWDGSTWAMQNVVAVGFDVLGWVASLALDSIDYPRISYYNASSDNLEYVAWDGGAWTAQVVDSVGNVGKWNSLALDSTEYPHISYYNLSSGSLKYARWDGSSWITTVVDDSGDVGAYSSIALDGNGYPHISYYNITGLDLKYARWDGAAWNIETVDASGDVGRYSSLALDGAGNAYISYRDEGGRHLKFAQWLGSSWNIEVVDAGLDVGADGSIALDAGGYVHISYADSTSWDLKYATGRPNRPPGMPATPTGPATGDVGVSYPYSTSATDPDGDQVKYTFDWGDSTTSETGYVNSGISAGQSHSWAAKGTYLVRARATDVKGATSPWSPSLTVAIASAPDAPTGLTASPAIHSIGLSWTAPANDGGSPVTNYTIYRGTSSGGEAILVEVGDTLAYFDSAVLSHTGYFYQVTAKNSIGEGPRSNEASAVPLSEPGQPINLVASGGVGNVTLTWSPPLSDGGSPIINYEVYRGTTSGGETHLTTLGNVLTHQDSGLTNGQTYYYEVSARNAIGEGPNSSEASATPMATTPGPPRSLTVTDVINGITLAWSPPLGDGGSPITNYTIYRGINGFSESRLATLGNVLTYADTEVYLPWPNLYSYHVSANNSEGEGPLSNGVSESPILPPSPCWIFDVTPGDRTITIKWFEPFESNGAPATRYSIYRGMSEGGETLLTTVPETGGSLNFTDTGLTNGQTYFYYITAWNIAGEGADSEEVNATPASVPDAPVNLAAAAGDFEVTLTWSPPADTGGLPITNYVIFRGLVSGGETFLIQIDSQLIYVDSGLTNGVTYYYKVAGLNAVGQGSNSTEANATPAAIPGAPQDLTAVAGDRQVTLTWSPPVDNGGLPITNYVIYRGIVSGGETLLIQIDDWLTYADSGLTNGVTYYYRIAALNSVGQGPDSNEVSATPATIPSEPLNVVATATDGQVTLTWVSPASDGGSPITNYTVYRGSTSGGETLLVTLGNVLTYTDTGLTNGQTYYYKLTALNVVGESQKSSEENATPTTGSGPPSGGKSILEETWFWLVIVAVIIIIVAVTVLILRKKRGKKEKEEPPERKEEAAEI
jgi:fibronectin type 3 domain-containing protein